VWTLRHRSVSRGTGGWMWSALIELTSGPPSYALDEAQERRLTLLVFDERRAGATDSRLAGTGRRDELWDPARERTATPATHYRRGEGDQAVAARR
jgi:hypothetical protein